MSPSPAEQAAYDELQCYTLGRGDEAFVHQHVVDAWQAQHAHAQSKPIGLCFALIGLYLHLEKGVTGRQVQRAHMALARAGGPWPGYPLPDDRGAFDAIDVMLASEGEERDRAIDAWCASVWATYRESHAAVAALVAQHGVG